MPTILTYHSLFGSKYVVFIISPYDKGGRLYAPSHLSRELMLPEMEPMEYGKDLQATLGFVFAS